MNGKDHKKDIGYIVKEMLDDTARTVDKVRLDIEKSVVNYTFLPGKDILETDDSIIVHLALPGINKENITLNLTESKLKIKAKLDSEHKMGGIFVTHKDRKHGYIRRTVRLPRKVMPEKAEAKFENGVLRVEIPKQEKDEGISIEIQ
ncbi:MAG: Hsp20/alpha crystallin family protein [Euryarchaeota archaeon]|jgi:HSP20 family protein|nr:Hsp20/alpha crystallin family protein [Euryarchaeota archaeon]